MVKTHDIKPMSAPSHVCARFPERMYVLSTKYRGKKERDTMVLKFDV